MHSGVSLHHWLKDYVSFVRWNNTGNIVPFNILAVHQVLIILSPIGRTTAVLYSRAILRDTYWICMYTNLDHHTTGIHEMSWFCAFLKISVILIFIILRLVTFKLNTTHKKALSHRYMYMYINPSILLHPIAHLKLVANV